MDEKHVVTSERAEGGAKAYFLKNVLPIILSVVASGLLAVGASYLQVRDSVGDLQRDLKAVQATQADQKDGKVEKAVYDADQRAIRETLQRIDSNVQKLVEDRIEELRAGPGGMAGLDNGAGAGGALQPGGRAGGSPMDDILIEELELGVRSYNCLKRAGIQTVGDLVQKSESELAAIPNFGRKSIEEVQETLRARGLSLRAD